MLSINEYVYVLYSQVGIFMCCQVKYASHFKSITIATKAAPLLAMYQSCISKIQRYTEAIYNLFIYINLGIKTHLLKNNL